MKIEDIINFLDAEVHPEYQEHYDNAGFLLGNPDTEYKGSIIALDLTMEVVDEAIERGVNLIVTHHPFIFSGIKRVIPNNATGKLIYKLIQNDLAVYSAHTNLDNLKNGVNGILAFRLGLTNCQILHPMEGRNNPEIGAGMIGELPYPMPAEAFLQQAKMAIGLPVLRISEVAKPVVSRVAICGGAGSFLIDKAVEMGADVYLTGDLKYHDFQHAENRITLADIGHYESEQFCQEIFYSIISKKFSNFACFISQRGSSFVKYI